MVAFLATTMLVLGAAGASLATDLPLVLTNDNVGMSADEIQEIQGPDDFKDLDAEGPEAFTDGTQDDGILKLTQDDIDGSPQAEGTVDETSEFTSAEEPAPEVAVVAAACPAEIETAGVATFEQCVEAAIRAGNGYSESAGVCRALFPAEAAPAS
jgi:hypothetical protein